MKRLAFSLVILLGYLTITQSIQTPSSPQSPSRRGSDASVKYGRAINSNSNPSNQVTSQRGTANENDEISETDSAFDNSPEAETDNTSIIFPTHEPPTPEPKRCEVAEEITPRNKWKKISLKALNSLGLGSTQVNLESIFKNHVANVKVESDQNGSFLTNEKGCVLTNEKNEKIIISKEEKPSLSTIHSHTSSAFPVASPRSRTTVLVDTITSPKVYSQSSKDICVPETKSVPLPITVPPDQLAIPRCARVKRCGGCCLLDNLECQPLSTKMINVTVQMFVFVEDDIKPLRWLKAEEVEVEEHTQCQCQCKHKPEHCNKFQDYVEDECSCVCKNISAKEKCFEERDKVWDENSCLCLCREFKECSSGQFYDLNSCQCKDHITRRNNAG